MAQTPAHFDTYFEIDGKPVGGEAPCYVIAEAGVAHFGDPAKALRLVELAADAGADAVKFQLFRADTMISGRSSPEWIERMRSRELPFEAFARIAAHAKAHGITFMCTAHEPDALDYLTALGVPAFKVGSGEVGNWPFIADHARRGRPLIISTGMYDAAQIDALIGAVAASGNRALGLLHCVTAYPTPPDEINLRAMDALRDRFPGPVGYSDHTAGHAIPLAAVARGAKILEKHITLDFDIPDAQDWKVSCGPDDLAAFVAAIRAIEASLGDGEKAPSQRERDAIWARKSLVAATDLPAGTVIGEAHLAAKRPGTGISPAEIAAVLGRRLGRPLAADEIVEWDALVAADTGTPT